MSDTLSFFDAIQDGFVVGADSFLAVMVVWNGSGTFSVYVDCGRGQWQERDVFTKYAIYTLADAREAATEYFNSIYEDMAAEMADETA